MCVIEYVEEKRRRLKDTDTDLLRILWPVWRRFNMFSINVKLDKGENTSMVVKISDENYFNDYEAMFKYLRPGKQSYVNWKENRSGNDSRTVDKHRAKMIKDWFGNECVFCGSKVDLIIANIKKFSATNDDNVYNLMCVCKKHEHERKKWHRAALIKQVIVPKLKRLHPEII